MVQGQKTPWFNGQFVGRGLSLPITWQGYAVLGAFAAASLGCWALLSGETREAGQAAIMIGTIALIHAKRA